MKFKLVGKKPDGTVVVEIERTVLIKRKSHYLQERAEQKLSGEIAMFVLDNGKRFVIPRTEMTYPGHNMKLHQNAADPVKSPVDHVMADFEDACPYEFKGEKSRKVMVEALNTLDFGKKIVTVRPNNIHSTVLQGRHGSDHARRAESLSRNHAAQDARARGDREVVEDCSTISKSAADGSTACRSSR